MSNPFVLMVDDDKDDCMLAADAFRRRKLPQDLRCMGSGEELLSSLETAAPKEWPSLILLDLNMPMMNGLEVLRRVKTEAKLKDIPVLVFTTSSRREDIRESYLAGANSYIVKPDSIAGYQDLVDTVSRYWFSTVALPDGHA